MPDLNRNVMTLMKIISQFVLVLLLVLSSAGCNSDGGGSDNSGLLSGAWDGYQVTATNGIAVTRDLVMKLSHNAENRVTGTKVLGDPSRNIKQTVDGEFFPESSVLDLTVTVSGASVKETWRLEDGGITLTLVSGGAAQVSRTN
jgi:hypothetical protein